MNKDSIDKDLDIVFLCADGNISKEYSTYFLENKTYVIDNSSAFRMNDEIPLVVYEVNRKSIKKDNYLIANPNCTTIQSVVPLKIIDDLFNIQRITYSTYQSVSGSGYEGVNDLINDTAQLYSNKIKSNLIPLIDDYEEDGFTKEEHKMINETRKILSKPNIEIAATCIRVPIVNTHGVSISVEVKEHINLNLLEKQLKQSEGIILRNETEKGIYPKAVEAIGNDFVYVGRIRKDLFNDRILHFYCVADNLRKGAAGNSVQIAKYLLDEIL